MTTDIENLDINELQALTKKATDLIEKKQRQKLENAYQQIIAIAEEVGMSIEELVQYGEQHPSLNKRSVAPRYRNPQDASQTWTGRGKKPRWVIEALEQGQSLEDISI